LPPPVGDQKRFLLCRNTTFSKDNVRAAALVFKSGTPPGGLKNAIQVPALLVERHNSRAQYVNMNDLSERARCGHLAATDTQSYPFGVGSWRDGFQCQRLSSVPKTLSELLT
jgi:hypothetical protein